jgi:hypothetical protein
MASLSPLQLDHFVVHKLVIEANPNYDDQTSGPDEDVEGYGCKMECKFGRQKGQNQFRGRINLAFARLKEVEAPYDRVEIDVEGFFLLPDDMPEERVGQFVPKLLAVNLIGIARGVVFQSTAFCPDGPFKIPLLDVSNDFDIEAKVLDTKSGSKMSPRQAKQRSAKD